MISTDIFKDDIKDNLVAAESLMDNIVVSAEDLLEDLAVAESLMDENLVPAESSSVAKKGPVLPPRIERHSEDIVLRIEEDSAFSPQRLFNRTTFTTSLKLLGYIKVDSLSI